MSPRRVAPGRMTDRARVTVTTQAHITEQQGSSRFQDPRGCDQVNRCWSPAKVDVHVRRHGQWLGSDRRREGDGLMARRPSDNKSFGRQKRLRDLFEVDPTRPLEQQENETDRMYSYFQIFLANPGLTLKELEPLMGVSYASVSRYRDNFQ